MSRQRFHGGGDLPRATQGQGTNSSFAKQRLNPGGAPIQGILRGEGVLPELLGDRCLGLLDGVVQCGDEGRGRGGIRWVAVGGQVDPSPEVR